MEATLGFDLVKIWRPDFEVRGGYPPVGYPPVGYPPIDYPPVGYPPVTPPPPLTWVGRNLENGF